MNKKIKQKIFILIIFLQTIFNVKCFLSTSFGSTFEGTQTTQVGLNSMITGLALQPVDGKIVVGGVADNQFVTGRYNPDGTLDTTYGTTGIVIATQVSNAQANSVLVQADGSIVVGGYSYDGVTNKITLLRYSATGVIDSGGFGTGGVVTTLVGTGSGAQSIAIETASQKIIAAGNSGNSVFTVARYTTAGVLDTATYNSGGAQPGVVTTTIGTQAAINGVAIDGSTRAVVAGYSDGKFAVARYTNAGVLDTAAFNSGGGQPGVNTTTIGTNATANAIAIQADGKILVAGFAVIAGVTQFAVARYTTAGVLDTATFNSGGSIPGVVTTPIGDLSRATGVAVDSAGNIMVVGTSDNQFAIARYTTAGVLDTTFNTTGFVTTPIGNVAACNSILISPLIAAQRIPDRTIYAGGTSDNDFALASYFGGTGIVSITNPTNNSFISGNVLAINGTSFPFPTPTVSLRIDNVAFVGGLPTSGGTWGPLTLTPVLSNGLHTIEADLFSAGTIIAKTIINTTVSSILTQSLAGNFLRVDATYGSDTLGRRNGYPFLTITAALAAASSGDVVTVYPGTYNESITIPAGVSVQGIDRYKCIMQVVTPIAATNLVTMNNNTVLENMTIKLGPTTADFVYNGIVFPASTVVNANINNVTINIDNSTSAGTQSVIGLSASTTTANVNISSSDIIITSTGNGIKSGIFLSLTSNVDAYSSNITVTRVGVAGSYFGIFSSSATSLFQGYNCVISGTTADISFLLNTVGIELNSCVLVNGTVANANFASKLDPSIITFSISGAGFAAATKQLYPGTTTFANAKTAAAGAAPIIRLQQPTVVRSISVQAVTGPGGARVDTWTLTKNSALATMSVTLTGAATSNTSSGAATPIAFAAGDRLGIQLVSVVGSTTTDPVLSVNCY